MISELLEWIQDYNRPVAHTLPPFLASVGRPLALYLRPIFEGGDEVWKYFVIDAVLANAPDESVEQFTPLLVRIADHPTPRERTEELDHVAAAALGRVGTEAVAAANIRTCAERRSWFCAGS